IETPRVVARGAPGRDYPWTWWVVTWLDGALPTADLDAEDLAVFLASLRAVDPTDAPEPGGGRGKPLAWRDRSVRDALERVDAPGAVELWQDATHASEWEGPPVWIHCDLDRRNVLVRGGRLAAVLDWEG